MCGICGWCVAPSESRDFGSLTALAHSLAHRGPDDSGECVDAGQGVAFAHNRLEIIDPTPGGHQPMATEDGSLVLNYNGEIYNFRPLRRQLEALGHSFRSASDTEVLLRAWSQWGLGALDRIRGMFAFAIQERAHRRLVLARDPMGMKPLYWTSLPGGGGFVFASEVKAFLRLDGFRPRVNEHALRQYMTFGYTWDEQQTIFEGVYKLPPGHFMVVEEGMPRAPVRYFTPPPVTPVASEEPRIAELYEVLREVVAEHLIADVPVGLLLSGGLDSSLIAVLAERSQRITTLTLGFRDSAVDEREYGRIVARHAGSDHHELFVSADELFEDVGEAVWAIDDLFGDWGVVTTRALYRKAKELGLKVVLVGEGADELFGGYPQFERARSSRGPIDLRLFDLFRHYSGRRYGRGLGEFRSRMRSYLDQSGGDLVQALRLFETQDQLPNNYVMKVDKASMSLSIEARAPFLDRRIAELAYRLPTDLLVRDGENKVALRRMAERFDLLPREILDRPKHGAAIAASWMDSLPSFREMARAEVLRPDGWADRLGLRAAMTAYFDENRTGYRFPRAISIFRNTAWRLLLLNLWSRRYLGEDRT
ncbi:MAG TPA: asparagine synthase (glutamine-hydrolyzing) [Thermoanaerobaculia bacterium]|nr:asparagine synthase (glutamine-hydrolyzing) [Thermoanaerobaculia bacterium]